MNIFHQIGWFYWDPPREAFTIPFINHSIVWYGILFVIGFTLAYFILNPIFARFLSQTQHQSKLEIKDPKQAAYFLTDRLCWFAVAGTIIGARLGAVLFYDWPYFSQYPLEIFKIWNGGLASHGGVLGVMLALYLYTKYIHKWVPQLTFLHLLDFVAIPSALTACFIRLGNFMNQEIVGTPTDLPWAVLFGHPTDSVAAIPRHPVQLYEAIAYLITFFILWGVWKNQRSDDKPGAIVGLLFIFVFGSRLLIEFWKAQQESILDQSFLQTGQLLSIPFILIGIFLFLRSKTPKKCSHCL